MIYTVRNVARAGIPIFGDNSTNHLFPGRLPVA